MGFDRSGRAIAGQFQERPGIAAELRLERPWTGDGWHFGKSEGSLILNQIPRLLGGKVLRRDTDHRLNRGSSGEALRYRWECGRRSAVELPVYLGEILSEELGARANQAQGNRAGEHEFFHVGLGGETRDIMP